MNEHHKTTDKDRVSRRAKLAYGAGAVSENTMQNAVSNMANPFFNVGLNVAPSLLGIAVLIFRVWDAVTDPIMGWFSDRTESRYGRRSPFIIGGALAGGLLFALMWWCPRGMSTTFYFFWYVIISLFFYTAFSIFSVPYVALGYELSPDYHERTRVMSYRTWFQSIGGFVIQWMFWMTQLNYFEDTVDGMRWVGIGVGALIIVMGVVPGVFLKERPLTISEKNTNREKLKLKNIFSVLKVRSFLYLLGALITAVLGVFLVIIFGFYINVYYLFEGDLKAASIMLGVRGSVYHACCMASIPLIVWTSTRIGKKNALQLFLMIAIIGNAIKWWVFTPDNPWLQLWSVALTAPGLSAVWILLSSMTADVTDIDELENGTRKEGSFSALYDWSMKLGFAFCFLIAGFILEWTGFDAALKGNQPPETLKSMVLLYTVVPVMGLVVSMVFVWRFPITEITARQVRKKLEVLKQQD